MEQLLALIADYGPAVYLFLFLYCALKSGLLPLFAGWAAQAGALDISLVFLATLLGGYLGDELRFVLARRYGWQLVAGRECLKRALNTAGELLTKHGILYIFAYRYPKGLRTIGALPVGLTLIPWSRFTVLNFASASLWSSLLVGAGYWLGQFFGNELAATWGWLGFVLLAAFALLTWMAWRKMRIDNAKTSLIP